MRKLVLTKSLCVALASLFLVPPTTNAKETEEVRHNGGSWIEFGPAIIDNGKRFVLYDSDNPSWKEVIEVVETDPEFADIKSWVKTHVTRSLNFSPAKPGPGAVWPDRMIKVFAGPPRRPKGMPIPQLLVSEDQLTAGALGNDHNASGLRDDHQDLLLKVPLRTDTLRLDSKTYESEYKKLKTLFESAQSRVTDSDRRRWFGPKARTYDINLKPSSVVDEEHSNELNQLFDPILRPRSTTRELR
jgi:hypothetical protein